MHKSSGKHKKSSASPAGPAGYELGPNRVMEERYRDACTQNNCINEHIPTLYEYAKRCERITECGVESCISTWAFARGLRDNGSSNKRLVSIDTNYHSSLADVRESCKSVGVDFTFKQGNDIYIEREPAQLVFIDTWHVKAQLSRELERWHTHAEIWIVMHDTTVDADKGETLRRGWNPFEDARRSGYPIDEIICGIWPAVTEFLASHPEWIMVKRWKNCNGLTVLQRADYRGPFPSNLPEGGEPSAEDLGQSWGVNPSGMVVSEGLSDSESESAPDAGNGEGKEAEGTDSEGEKSGGE